MNIKQAESLLFNTDFLIKKATFEDRKVHPKCRWVVKEKDRIAPASSYFCSLHDLDHILKEVYCSFVRQGYVMDAVIEYFSHANEDDLKEAEAWGKGRESDTFSMLLGSFHKESRELCVDVPFRWQQRVKGMLKDKKLMLIRKYGFRDWIPEALQAGRARQLQRILPLALNEAHEIKRL